MWDMVLKAEKANKLKADIQPINLKKKELVQRNRLESKDNNNYLYKEIKQLGFSIYIPFLSYTEF